MNPSPTGGDSRRRGKKARSRHGRRKRSHKNKNNRRHNQQKAWTAPEHGRDDISVLGGRTPKARDNPAPVDQGGPTQFNLFCAYHLGITRDDGFRDPNPNEVARRFGLTKDELNELLRQHKLDPKSVASANFDLDAARMDIRVCPEGISRTETARGLFDWFCEEAGIQV